MINLKKLLIKFPTGIKFLAPKRSVGSIGMKRFFSEIPAMDEQLLAYIGDLKEKVERGIKDEQSLDIQEPDVPKESFNEIKSLNKQIGELLRLGQMEEANIIARECVDLVFKYYPSNHPVSLSAMNNLSIILKKNGEFQEAKSIMINVFEGYCSILGARYKIQKKFGNLN